MWSHNDPFSSDTVKCRFDFLIIGPEFCFRQTAIIDKFPNDQICLSGFCVFLLQTVDKPHFSALSTLSSAASTASRAALSAKDMLPETSPLSR